MMRATRVSALLSGLGAAAAAVAAVQTGADLAVGVSTGLTAHAAAVAAARTGADREWAAIVDVLDRAVVVGDAEGIDAARDRGLRLLDGALTGRQRARVRYLVAYANWRALGARPDLAGGDRDRLADEAAALLAENIAARDADVEAHALLGAVFGMKIGSSTWRGMTLGRRAARAFDAARAIDERNPRFLLLKGIDAFHRPAMFGGGPERAEAWFRSAIGHFEAQPPDLPWPNWGLLDARAWLGQTLARRGDPDGAREQYGLALEAAPDYAFVRRVLLPGLGR